MDSHKIEELLEKYWLGESTLKEEEMLKRYFQDEQPLPEHLLPYRTIFGKEATAADLPSSLASEDASEWLQKQQPSAKLIFWKQPYFRSIAASIALILSLSIAWDTLQTEPQYTDISKQQAYEEVQEALSIFAKGYHRGQAHIQLVAPLNEAVIIQSPIEDNHHTKNQEP